MPNRRPHDHISASMFQIEIEGVTQGAFTAVDGLEISVDVASYADGNDMIVRKRPGRIHYGNIVLKRGYVDTVELWQWFKAVLDGRIERRAGSVILTGDDRSVITRYNFYEAWPCRWKGFAFNAMSSDTLVEELELAVERIERA